MGKLKASEVTTLTRSAQAVLAREAEMGPVIAMIVDVAKTGKYYTLVNGLTDGQVFKLQQLGYLVTNSGPNQHEVDWNDRGR